ncbi:TetR/AcrR family transcriptional regulator [Methylobacterium aerolatum]|uniref:AcrR family transcriptional regulator n=1 Tax=Methylobacterium aerolatum TaxID=418708 RepID=A0ABU0I1I1_9HYPH|nr:TetR/AcrR family transcriptional regulator [Methylobacterium aerolatum]MDQ0448458.1 AcrR family transcriptional regulator [Methylobacterium aerolatum]
MAERAFLGQGFTETTMQSIAAAAGASKETLYRHFKSKDDLLIEIVLARTAELRRALDGDVDSGAGMAAVLTHLGRNLLTAVTTPDTVALLRIVIAETVRNPDLGLSLYTAGPERTNRLLTGYLAAAKSRGEFHGDDAALAASLFLGSVLGNEPLVGLLRRPKHPMTAKAIEARVGEAVTLFMTRYAATPPGAAEAAPSRTG